MPLELCTKVIHERHWVGCHLEPDAMKGLAQELEQDLGNQNMALKSKKKTCKVILETRERHKERYFEVKTFCNLVHQLVSSFLPPFFPPLPPPPLLVPLGCLEGACFVSNKVKKCLHLIPISHYLLLVTLGRCSEKCTSLQYYRN